VNQTILDRTLAQLREHHIRVTPQREAIISYLIESEEHPTAEKIYADLSPHFPQMSVATVYNNLRLLVDLKLIQEMSSNDAATHFDFMLHPHSHAICTNCGKIVDFDYEGLSDVAAVATAETGFKVSGHHLEVYGLCPDCQILLGETN